MNSDTLWLGLEAMCAQLTPDLPGGGLEPPAQLRELHEAEQVLGRRLPSDLRFAYLRHNGTACCVGSPDFFPGCSVEWWTGLSTMIDDWREARDSESSACQDTRNMQRQDRLDLHGLGAMHLGGGWTRHRIALARLGHNALMIDGEPGPSGCAGQLLEVDLVAGTRWIAPSLHCALEWLLVAWQSGRVTYSEMTSEWVVTASGQTLRRLYELAPPRQVFFTGQRPQSMMGEAVNQASHTLWQGLEGLCRTLCPDSPQHGLAAPATVAQILAAEAHLGFCLPDEWRLAYLRHDGQLPNAAIALPHLFVPGFRWLSLAEMCHLSDETQAHRRQLLSLLDCPNEAGAREVVLFEGATMIPSIYCQFRIPIGQSSSGLVYLDMDPGPSGSMGQLRSDKNWHAHSLQAAAQPLLNAWQAGRIDWQPEPGRWVWRDGGDALERIYDLDRPLQAAPWLDDEIA